MSKLESASSRYSLYLCVCVCVCVCVCFNFHSKQRAWKCSAQIWPKIDLGLEIQKMSQCRNKNQHPRDNVYANFQAKLTTSTFRRKFAQK